MRAPALHGDLPVWPVPVVTRPAARRTRRRARPVDAQSVRPAGHAGAAPFASAFEGRNPDPRLAGDAGRRRQPGAAGAAAPARPFPCGRMCGHAAAPRLPLRGSGRRRGAVESNPRISSPHSLAWNGCEYPLREGVTVIGRADDADLQISLPSRHHARIVVRGPEATLEDLGSRHCRWRGTTPVQGVVRLASGDEIRLGTGVARLLPHHAYTTDTTRN